MSTAPIPETAPDTAADIPAPRALFPGDLAERVAAQAAAAGFALTPGQEAALAALAPLTTADAGAYVFGEVGRGKTWLLDAVTAQIQIDGLARHHFHGFFRAYHDAIAEHFPAGGATDLAFDDLLEGVEVLFFDEFHVHDSGNASLLFGLLRRVLDRGIVLLTSSNYAPEGLLPDPDLHDVFEPAIDLLERSLTLVELSGDRDLRTPGGHGFASGSWDSELDPAATERYVAWVHPGVGAVGTEHADRAFRSRNAPPRVAPVRPDWTGDVELRTPTHRFLVDRADTELHFRFPQVFEEPSAVRDYLLWAERFDRWVITDVPALWRASEPAQQRFVDLIDVLCDRDIELHVHSTATRAQLLERLELPRDLARTASRLALLRGDI